VAKSRAEAQPRGKQAGRATGASRAKGEPRPAEEPVPLPIGGYHYWSRDPAVGLFAVLPLWLVYEGLRLTLAPAERNGAEAMLIRELARLGPYGLMALRVALGVAMFLAARSLLTRDVPWLRVALVVALEGTVYGLLLGPTAAALTTSAERFLVVGNVGGTMVTNLVGSLGAGIFEELVFRLGLMSALVWLGLRAMRAWALPPLLAAALVGCFAVVVSAVVFSWFHHLCGEPFDARRFLFRAVAGVLLGLLMWARGFGVCVYTHAFYDIHYYLTNS
jgi:hypothetical protein